MAIAKAGKISILTGDGALRKAAKCENVTILGTLGILDQLLDGKFIVKHEYELCLLELQKHNGQKVRFPKNEIISRLQQVKK